jgi:hypothetical protein
MTKLLQRKVLLVILVSEKLPACRRFAREDVFREPCHSQTSHLAFSGTRVDTCLLPVSRFQLLRDLRSPSPIVASAPALRTINLRLSMLSPTHYFRALMAKRYIAVTRGNLP